jgi:hypothetical protein
VGEGRRREGQRQYRFFIIFTHGVQPFLFLGFGCIRQIFRLSRATGNGSGDGLRLVCALTSTSSYDHLPKSLISAGATAMVNSCEVKRERNRDFYSL